MLVKWTAGLCARCLLALGFLVCALCAATRANEAPATPLLRIDSGAHSAPIRAIAVDAAGRYAVTAAEDKTARVWDLSDGHLLQTLRPPSGVGNNGKLFAAAITANGAFVAVGGWSAENDVYLFERATGRMLQRITGLPNIITRLSFSPDGQLLLVSLWGKHGVRIFEGTDDWLKVREAGSDASYQGESYGASFSSESMRLVTSSQDGLVRLYDVREHRLKLLKSVRPAGGGSMPFGVAFSPGGKHLALGYSDSPAVLVLDADTLQTAYLPDVSGIDNGSLSSVAWSVDGRELLAAGTWIRTGGRYGLRRWADGGRGRVNDASMASNSVVGLCPLSDGRVLFAAADASWGWLPGGTMANTAGSSTAPAHLFSSGLMDLRGRRADFRVSKDGSALSFGFRSQSSATQTTAFDLSNSQWTRAQAAWTPAKDSGRDLLLEDWFESVQPKLNRRLLALSDNEVSMTAAVAADSSGFVLGTSAYFRYYQKNGAEKWRVAVPATTWQVNLSSDGRWVLAAFADGTVRWYRSRDGLEMVALFLHADGKRWVAWTAQGHYSASPGGEDLFGWQIDRGLSRPADFFPGSRFRSRYFRPEVIAQVLASADFEAAHHQTTVNPLGATSPAAPPQVTTSAAIESQTPPVVNVLSPKDGDGFSNTEVLLRVSIRSPIDSPPTSLRARLNGNLYELPAARSLTDNARRNSETVATRSQEFQYEQRIRLPPSGAELMLFAENRNGYSTPAVLRLRWDGAGSENSSALAPQASALKSLPSAAPGVGDLRPVLYVLAIGVSKYLNKKIELEFAAKDAGDFSRVFKAQESQLYRKVEVKLLTDTKARRDDILDGLEWIRREMTSRDVGVVFMAGHGVNDNDGVYYYLPQDTEVDKIKRSGVIFTEIRNTLASLPGKAIFFIDTCHSGNVLGTGRRAIGRDLTAVVNELSSAENGVIVFAASTGRQEAQESPEWGNGAFTRAVIEGVSGKADLARTGRITHKMLDLYVSERVKALTQGAQSPVTIVPQGIPDFPVAISH
jgi:WD40 repeat protein